MKIIFDSEEQKRNFVMTLCNCRLYGFDHTCCDVNCLECWSRYVEMEVKPQHEVPPIPPLNCSNIKKEGENIPMKVFVIGSLSCKDRIDAVAAFMRELGDNVETVQSQPDKSFEDVVYDTYSKIESADRIVVVTKEDGSIGEGTTYEVAFAKFLGKQVTTFRKLI